MHVFILIYARIYVQTYACMFVYVQCMYSVCMWLRLGRVTVCPRVVCLLTWQQGPYAIHGIVHTQHAEEAHVPALIHGPSSSHKVNLVKACKSRLLSVPWLGGYDVSHGGSGGGEDEEDPRISSERCACI